MKKFLLSLTLFTALLGVALNSSAAPCVVGNLVFNIKEYKTENGKCYIRVDVGWNMANNNNGLKLSTVHLWTGDKYPAQPFNYAGNSTGPNAAFLANALGTIQVEWNQQQNKWVYSPSYRAGQNPSGTPKLITNGTLSVTVGTSNSFLITDAIIEMPDCNQNFSIKGDIWGGQNTNSQQCGAGGYSFLPPLADFDITGSLTCAYKDGLPDNKFSVTMTSNAAVAAPYTVSYSVYVDNNAPIGYNAGTEILVPSRTVSNIPVYTGAAGTYNSGSLTYLSSFTAANQYLYRTRNVYVVASVSYTQNGGGTFTRILPLTNSCQAETVPAPTANPDFFELGMDGWEGNTPLKAHVYGNYAKWANDPIAAGHQVKSLSAPPAVNSGTDGDNTDAPLSAMKFTFSGLTLENGPACESATPNLGTLTPNEKGYFEYTPGALCVNVVSFTYTMQNTLSGLSTGPIKVTIQISAPIILPVSYKSFTATRSSNSQVVLEWETAMEENNRGFHVQRYTDGNWKNIGFVFTQANGGNSSEVLKYAFKDANNSKGITQYRILQVDIDGKGKYSEVRAVRGLETAATKITLFPNPSHNGSFSLLFEDGTSVRDVVVSDVSGRVVKQFKSVNGSTLTVNGLVDGFYTVQVANRSNGTTSTEKVIIKKR